MPEVAPLAAVALLIAAPLDAADWSRADPDTPGVYVATGQAWPSEDDMSFRWSGLRIIPRYATVELIATKEFVPNTLTNSFGLKESGDGRVVPFEYSLSEVWSAVEDDPTVVGVVPVGYLERGGVPDVAGLIQIDGKGPQQIMHAPPLTAVYCLDTPRDQPRATEFQWAYNFAIEYDVRLAYTYSPDLSAVQFEGEGISGNRLRREFSACEDKIQAGPRILEPRRREGANGLKDRRSKDILRDDEGNRTRTRRTILVYDLSGDLTFLTTHDVAKLGELADLTSDARFYRRTPAQCARAEAKASGGEGERDPQTGRAAIRSQSCEYWAMVLTSFEHSGLIIRRRPDAPPIRVGRTDSMIGAALIIRSRRPAPVN